MMIRINGQTQTNLTNFKQHYGLYQEARSKTLPI